MLNSSGLKDHLRSGVWNECAMTVTFLSNITSIKNKTICPYQLLFGSKARLPESLRSFGEIGVVMTKSDIQGKLSNRGTPCIFMGYSVNHAHDVYRMLNMETKKVINSRDMIWLNQVYNDWKVQKVKMYVEDDEGNAVEPKIQHINELQEEVQEEVQEEKVLDEQKRAKIYRILHQLESSFNPEASRIVERIEQGREILLNHANFAIFSGGVVEQVEPTTFNEVWDHNDPRTREKWREAINKQFEEMKKKEVWEVMKKEVIPQDTRTIKCKWIFKIKRNGVFRARLVACGYSQIPGIDFNQTFAPVVNNVSFRIILITKLCCDLQASIFGVETTFLHNDLREEMYMNVREGMEQDSNSFVILKKTIYGLVQGARKFYNKLLPTLKSMGFIEKKSDPCLLLRWTEDSIILIRIYVDDCLVVAKDEEIKKDINDLKINGFNLNTESSLKD